MRTHPSLDLSAGCVYAQPAVSIEDAMRGWTNDEDEQARLRAITRLETLRELAAVMGLLLLYVAATATVIALLWFAS